MHILSLAYCIVPCLAFTNLTEHVGNWAGHPSASLGSSLQSPFGLAVRQGGCSIPGGLACPDDAADCCAADAQCCGDPPLGCCSITTNCFTAQNGTLECCPADAQTCGGTICCQTNGVCCSSSPTGCCAPDGVCCESTIKPCCGVGTTCCGDVCCTAEETCSAGVCQAVGSGATPTNTAHSGGATTLADTSPTGVPNPFKSGAIHSKLGSIWSAVLAVGSTIWFRSYV